MDTVESITAAIRYWRLDGSRASLRIAPRPRVAGPVLGDVVVATADQISLSPGAARAALAQIEDLGFAPVWETVDYSIAVLRGLRARLRRGDRLVPATAWPELEAFVRDTPGLMTELTPRIRVPERERAALTQALRQSHRHPRELGARPGFELLAIEGLINALAGPELVHGIGGHDLGRIVGDVLTMARVDLRHLPEVARQLPG